jgi:hypothetical protein
MRVLSLFFIPRVLSFKNSLNTEKILDGLPFILPGVIL